MQIVVAFPMNKKGIGTGLDKFIKEEVRGRDHEMSFELQRSQVSERLHDRSSHRNVGHEMAVHDVDVNPVRPCLNRFVDVCRKMAEVRSENRRCEFHAASIHPPPLFARSKTPTNCW